MEKIHKLNGQMPSSLYREWIDVHAERGERRVRGNLIDGLFFDPDARLLSDDRSGSEGLRRHATQHAFAGEVDSQVLTATPFL